jgi:pimeloyl-ACP methyl ester carboxylesterase
MARHHGQMTSTPSWHVAGPPARDDLAAWTTATLDDGELGEIPGLSQPAPPGRTELVSGGGVNVRVRPGPTGPTPAFYVHGLGGASTDWTRLSAALATRATGYSIDLPGSGRSDPPPGGRYSPAVDARVVAATIERVAAGPVHLVGNSYGGVITTLVAARWPHLVRSLTVLAPAVPDLSGCARKFVGGHAARGCAGLVLMGDWCLSSRSRSSARSVVVNFHWKGPAVWL